MRKISAFIDNHFVWVSLGVSVGVSVAFVAWAERYGGRGVLDEALKNNRSAVFGALASIFGSLLGFTITAVSVVVGFATSDRLAIVRDSKHYPALWAAFTHTIKVLGVATLIALAALIADRDAKPLWFMTYAMVFASVLAVLLLCRSIWALEQVVHIVAKPPKPASETQPSAPK